MKTDFRYHFAGIIPARYASSRLPGKPLAMIGGKPMIQVVFEQASRSLDKVYVATDDERIRDAVREFGGTAVMTSGEHRSGTDRCAEAVQKIIELEGSEIDVVVNIQGDEPFIQPSQIDQVTACFEDETVEIATLIRKVVPGEDISDQNAIKTIIDLSGNAIYFSRAAIPFVRDAAPGKWTFMYPYYTHLGVYAFKTATLAKITSLPQSTLEKAESLEQNRWLENGFRIRTAVTGYESICVDTPEDLEKANLFFNEMK